MALLAELERRLAKLEATEAIRNLKMRYAAACDDQYNPHVLAEMFTEDAVWDGQTLGMHRGRDEIRKFFETASGKIFWAFHLMLNPVISIDEDGSTATGTWFLFEPCTMPAGNQEKDSVLMMAKYNDRYRKVDGEWKFERVEITYECIANLHPGWAAQPFRVSEI